MSTVFNIHSILFMSTVFNTHPNLFMSTVFNTHSILFMSTVFNTHPILFTSTVFNTHSILCMSTVFNTHPILFMPTEQDEARVSATQDNDVFVYLARTYSYSHATMRNSTPCAENDDPFLDGITNGAGWYRITGTADQPSLRSFPPKKIQQKWS